MADMIDNNVEEILERYRAPDAEADEQPKAQQKSAKDDGKKLTAAAGSSFTNATPTANDAGKSACMTPGLRALDAGRGSRGYQVQANKGGGKRR